MANSEVAQWRAEVTPGRLREALKQRFADWKGVLQRHPAQARQIIKKLLTGPLKFTPKDGYYKFDGEVSFAKLLTESVFPILVASPAGFEPAVSALKGQRVGPATPWGRYLLSVRRCMLSGILGFKRFMWFNGFIGFGFNGFAAEPNEPHEPHEPN